MIGVIVAVPVAMEEKHEKSFVKKKNKMADGKSLILNNVIQQLNQSPLARVLSEVAI